MTWQEERDIYKANEALRAMQTGTAAAQETHAAGDGSLDPHGSYLRRCGEAIWGKVDFACGRFLPKTNWMRRDGADGRGGERGNAPLCWRCSE